MNQKKDVFLRISIVLLISFVLSVSVVSCNKQEPKPARNRTSQAPAQAAEPKPQPKKEIESLIDGMMIPEDQAGRRPIAVMVENSFPIRPQEGLGSAEMVFEGLSEAGITRCLAVFSHNDVEKLGPVRSARNHFVAMANGFNAIYGHCGGSIYALDLIKEWNVTDFDQMAYPNSYWRVPERKRPHNLFTSTVKIREDAEAAGIKALASFDGFKHKDDLPLEARTATQNIAIEFSTNPYKVEYKFDKNTNSYLRYNGGVPHLDKNIGKQLCPKNVIIMVADTAPIPGGSGCLDISVIARNKMIAFMDGKRAEGYWQKVSSYSQVQFYDSSGTEMSLNRGQTWVEIVAPDTPLAF